MTIPGAADAPPVWCIVANVVPQRPYGPGGAETKRGIRLFRPGAKLWVPGGYAGMGYDVVVIIGRTRHSQRYSVVAVATKYLTNWRVKQLYSPAVLALLDEATGQTAGNRFSDHDDRTSTAFRDDLIRQATEFRQRTKLIHEQWAAATDADPVRVGRSLTLVDRVRRLLTPPFR
jgi:hypothetical protein